MNEQIFKVHKVSDNTELRLMQTFYGDKLWISIRLWVRREGKWLATKQGISLRAELFKESFLNVLLN